MADKPNNIVRFKRPPRKRVVRVYIRLAHKDHGNCWHCEEPISAGDEYRGEVYTYGRKLWVRKEHHPLTCHPPDDEETYRKWEEIRKREELASKAEQRIAQAA